VKIGGFPPTADNSALGRLIFDAGEDALFHVQAVGSSSALYVDFLELRDFATNRVVSGGSTNFIAFSIDPNMKIYYAGAVANGASITEELNGANGGGFVWVPSFAGVFSSTNLVFPGGSTYKLNRSLVESSNLDSDGDGIVNSLDQTPVLVGSEINLTIGRTNLPPMASLAFVDQCSGIGELCVLQGLVDRPRLAPVDELHAVAGWDDEGDGRGHKQSPREPGLSGWCGRELTVVGVGGRGP